MFKHQFPFFANKPEQVYLDSAATTQKHESVIAAVNNYHSFSNATVHRSAYAIANEATQLYEEARSSVAALIACNNSSQIILNSGATESINTIAAGLHRDMLQGEKILILASEHHANILPWQQLSKRLGMSIDIVHLSKDGQFQQSEYEAFKRQLNESVAIVAMAHVSNALGNIYPVQSICYLAKQVKAISVIDGTQAIAHLPVNIEELACDFYVFSAHKMYGPTGVGVLFGRMELLENLTPLKLGGEMIRHVSFTDAHYQAPPLKFEGGTPNISGVIGLGAAAKFLSANLREIQNHEKRLYETLTSGLLQIKDLNLLGNLNPSGNTDVCSESIGLHSFVLKNHNLHDLAQLIYQQNIAVRVGHHCAMPLMQCLKVAGTMRVSIACYTTEADIQIFLDCLLKAIQQLKTGDDIKVQKISSARQLGKQLDEDTKETTNLPIAAKIRDAKGWDNQYRQLMLASKHLEILPVELRIDENAVFGCESELWITWCDNRLCAYTQSKVVRGILALLLEKVDDLQNGSKQESTFDYFEYLTELNLSQFFSVGRKDGIQNAIAAIKNKLV
ncbi:MAG: cysteine desulfurase/selenocysteine lyase [Glaciecola sp.]